MKIRIKKTVEIPEIPGEVDVRPGETLANLLTGLFAGTYFAGEVIDDSTGALSLDGQFQVFLNDVPVHSLPEDMETRLRDDDLVKLSLILIGGG